MTLFHHRSPGRSPVFDGDFPDDGQSATEVLERIQPASWDGTTITFSGASAVGLPPHQVYQDAGTVAGLRQAIETTALAERAPGPPARLRALPPPGRHDDDTIARDMAHGWPHLFEVRCAYPAADVDTPIPCGAVHRDGAARTFRGLRTSAWAAGWHLDAFGRWACPGCCQDSPDYRTLYPVAVWHPEAANARLAGDPAGEFWARAAAEHDLVRDVRDAARHGRHAGGAR